MSSPTLSRFTPPLALSSVRALAERFDTLILDLWGVVHDGAAAFPQSAETLRRLKEAGVTTLLLSNAPRRAHTLIAQMETFGIPRDLYGEVMSSGEAVRRELIDRTDPFFAALGHRCYHIGRPQDRSLFEDVSVEIVESLQDADYIVNTSPREQDHQVADYEAELAVAIARDLPMVCANPDRVVIRQGKRIVCAGAIADRYSEIGGRVAWRGKPDPAIYRLCLEVLGGDPSRIAVVGDALETDMLGAKSVGLSGIWVTGGIHANDVGGGYGVPAIPALVADLCKRHELQPYATLPGFIW